MPIKVTNIDVSFPGHFSSQQARASALGYAGLEFLIASTYLVESIKVVGPLFNVVLPIMHQTLELFSKAIAFTADPNFEPRKYSHRVADILNAYSTSVPVFASMLADHDTVELLEELEKSYIGIRYGECTLMFDIDAWNLFKVRAEELVDELYARTGLRFLPKHYSAP
jgi:hypothetical protein